MYLNKLKLWNFRKYGSQENVPGLEVEFQKGVNLLVGENDSGKSTIIDAIKIVLLTQSHEYIRITEDDFHINNEKLRVDEFKIECEFEDFSENEAKNFLEWLEFYKEDNVTKYRLKLTFNAKLKNLRVYTDLRAGADDDGTKLEAAARDMLRSIYLRPLRDAEKEMQSGRNSRLSQILSSHSTFEDGDNHKIVDIIRSANNDLEKYFSEDGDGNDIISKIVSQLEQFSSDDSLLSAKFSIADLRLKSILERLSLSLEKTQPGLGSLNLLFIASELLLLQKGDNGGLKIALIEEIEAHLHSQAQLRLIEFIQEEYDQSAVQFILSTHSPNLASKVNIKNIILCKNSNVYSLAPQHTKLEKGDYLFLQRFLNSTKANMFFAQGLILVEGSAEQLIIPQLAKLIKCPLSKKGVSLVNVDGTAFLRYSRIFVRSDGEDFDMPVSCITDCDVKPQNKDGDLTYTMSDLEKKIAEKEAYYTDGKVAGFVSPFWTLEYVLALSSLKKEFYKAVLYAKKIQNSNKVSLTLKKIKDVDEEVAEKFESWEKDKRDKHWIAYEIYHNEVLENKISKAIIAQCFASSLEYSVLKADDKITKDLMFDVDLSRKQYDKENVEKLRKQIKEDNELKYLVSAIEYASRVKKIEGENE